MNVTERDKKFLWAGGAVLAVYLLITFGIQPLTAQQKSASQQIENKIRFIQKYQQVLSRKSYYEAKARAVETTRAQIGRRFLSEDKPGLATAKLQKILEQFARQAGVAVERVRVQPPEPMDTMTAIPIELTLRSSLKKLSRFLYQIENHEKLLVVANLLTRRTNKTEPETLETQLRVQGFIMQPRGTQKT